MSGHTPGPWRAECLSWGCISPFEHTWEVTQERHPGEWYDLAETLTEADAKLMAAAPDLLEALTGIVAAIQLIAPTADCKPAQMAIAKAIGETSDGGL